MQAEGLPHLLLFPLLLLELSGLFLLLSGTCLESAEIIVYEIATQITVLIHCVQFSAFAFSMCVVGIQPSSMYYHAILLVPHLHIIILPMRKRILAFLPLFGTTRTPHSWLDVRHVLIAAMLYTSRRQLAWLCSHAPNRVIISAWAKRRFNPLFLRMHHNQYRPHCQRLW